METPDAQAGEYGDERPLPHRAFASVVAVLSVVAAGLVLFLATRSPGAPSPPIGVQAEAVTCSDAACDRIEPRVTLTWTAPESGADPTGYRVLRDGAPLGDVGPEERSIVDDVVTMGERYAYQIVALSDEGDSEATAPVTTTVPVPPDQAAHLAGVYRMSFVVRAARSIGSAFGITNPLPGKRGRDRWSFTSTCEPNQGTCPSTWSGLEGRIVPDDLRWVGTVQGLPARCPGGDRADAPIELDLETVDTGVVDRTWAVTGFRGLATVSFQCPGFPRSSATVEVTGTI